MLQGALFLLTGSKHVLKGSCNSGTVLHDNDCLARNVCWLLALNLCNKTPSRACLGGEEMATDKEPEEREEEKDGSGLRFRVLQTYSYSVSANGRQGSDPLALHYSERGCGFESHQLLPREGFFSRVSGSPSCRKRL